MTIQARPRSPWESMDLGFALARAWFGRLWLCWWLTAGPVALVAALVLHRHPQLWLLLLWWCKPAFEALPLYWLSRAVFGEQLAVAATLRSLPQALPPRLWPQCLWRRIAMDRAFSMPVTLLEAPRGPARRQRLRRLGTGASGWLTLVCAQLEAIFWLSGILLLAFLIPAGLPMPDLTTAFVDTGSASYWAGSLLLLVAMSVVAPCYVAAGFALYLGRRTELEAWDLELAFRRRRSPRGGRSARAGAASLLLTTALAALPPSPIAAAVMTPAEAKARIEAVLAQPDFGDTREAHVWVYVGADGPSAAAADDGAVLPAWLIQALASGAKWVLIGLAAGALIALALRLLPISGGAQRRRRRRLDAGAPASPPHAGKAPTPPTDIAAAVRHALAIGDVRGALGLLYRGQVTQLRATGLALPDGATEAECLRAARASLQPQALTRLARVVTLWRAAAYGHQPVHPDSVAALLRTEAKACARDDHG